MIVMTTTSREPRRDTQGRFTAHPATVPEVDLAGYLADTSDGSDFDIHAFHDGENAEDREAAYAEWLEEDRAHRDIAEMDMVFDRPDPALTDTPADPRAWEKTPF